MSSANTRTIETSISYSNLEAQVAAFLYATGFVHDNEDVVKLDLGDPKDGLVPLKITIKKEPEVKRINRNG